MIFVSQARQAWIELIVVRLLLPPELLPAHYNNRTGDMPDAASSIHDSWGFRKATAASGGRGHAAGCAVLLNVVVSDLPSHNFL
jgi:hypothetical protein